MKTENEIHMTGIQQKLKAYRIKKNYVVSAISIPEHFY